MGKYVLDIKVQLKSDTSSGHIRVDKTVKVEGCSLLELCKVLSAGVEAFVKCLRAVEGEKSA